MNRRWISRTWYNRPKRMRMSDTVSTRFRGTIHGHAVPLDADESMVVVDRIHLFVDTEVKADGEHVDLDKVSD